jgi:hypothetical protein
MLRQGHSVEKWVATLRFEVRRWRVDEVNGMDGVDGVDGVDGMDGVDG